MGEYVYSVWIKATPAQVWETYVDPARIPEWQTGKPVIEDVRGDPGEPGSTYVSRRGPLVARTTVLTSDVPSRLVTRAGGTYLELTAETHWPRGRRWVGRLVDRVILSAREADKEFRNLRTIIERKAAG
jgi:hypothetical protein